jgi:hypothetical protein
VTLRLGREASEPERHEVSRRQPLDEPADTQYVFADDPLTVLRVVGDIRCVIN